MRRKNREVTREADPRNIFICSDEAIGFERLLVLPVLVPRMRVKAELWWEEIRFLIDRGRQERET